jgi:hypothetical protein
MDIRGMRGGLDATEAINSQSADSGSTQPSVEPSVPQACKERLESLDKDALESHGIVACTRIGVYSAATPGDGGTWVEPEGPKIDASVGRRQHPAERWRGRVSVVWD